VAGEQDEPGQGGARRGDHPFDLLAWTAVTWFAVRAVRGGDDRLWLVAGVVRCFPSATPGR